MNRSSNAHSSIALTASNNLSLYLSALNTQIEALNSDLMEITGRTWSLSLVPRISIVYNSSNSIISQVYINSISNDHNVIIKLNSAKVLFFHFFCYKSINNLRMPSAFLRISLRNLANCTNTTITSHSARFCWLRHVLRLPQKYFLTC